MPTLGIAVVGCGYWGQNLLRNFCELAECEVVAICDVDLQALTHASRRFRIPITTQEYENVLSNSDVDAVVLATPPSTHYAFAYQALRARKDVLVENPLAENSRQAEDLIRLAQTNGKKLMVDHTSIYKDAVRRLKALVDSGDIGELLYFDSVRIAPGLIESDSDVLWHFGPCDLAVLDYLYGREPLSVSAIGVERRGTNHEDIAYLIVNLYGDSIAHFHWNWLAPMKIRRTLISGTKQMIVYDDINSCEKLRIYDKAIIRNYDPERRERMLTGYRSGDMIVPNLDNEEALRLVAREFVACISKDRSPLSDGRSALRVIRLLEAAQQSMDQNGRFVYMKEAPVRRPPVPIFNEPGVPYAGGSHAGFLSNRS